MDTKSTTQNTINDIKLKDATWFWNIIEYFKPLYIHVGIASFMVNIFALAMPLFVMNVYDRIVPNSAFESLFVLSIGVFIVFILDLILRNTRAYFVELAGRNADVLLLGKFMDTLAHIRLDAMPEISLGSLLSKVREFEYVREFMGSTTLIALLDLPFILLFLFIIAMLGGWIVIVPLCALPILFIFSWAAQRKFEEATKSQLKTMAEKNSFLGEIAAGFETVRATGLHDALTKRWDKLVDKAAISNAEAKLLGVSMANINLFINSSVSVGLVIFGVFLIDSGKMSMGALIACVILLGRCLAPLSSLVNVASNFHKAKLGLKSLHLLINMPKEDNTIQEDNTNLINKISPFESADNTIEEEKDIHAVKRAQHVNIFLDDVSFKYPTKSAQGFALSHVNLKVHKGERIGIIGKTGSGKSTLSRLLAGLYLPTEGKAFFGSTEVYSAPMRSIRNNIGILPQQIVLFSGTVRSNICDAWPKDVAITEGALLELATLCGVMDFCKKHPLGLDMPIDEFGVGLSGGQSQALALARALAGNPDILILDEPSSNLDIESEKLLIKRLIPFLKNKTLILLTHRTSLLELVDRLIVMEDGRIAKDVPLRHKGDSNEQA